MTYILLSILIIILSIILPILILFLIEGIRKKKIRLGLKLIISITSSIILMLSILLIYMSIHYSPEEDSYLAIESDSTVEVIDESNYYFFNNLKNDTDAIIFYGGAKVDEVSYAPLLRSIADEGIDVYLIKMPFHFALLGKNKADEILSKKEYTNIYLMGHSLGGTTLSLYLSKCSYEVDGIIFLASYPSKEIKDGVSSLSIYGSEDLVLNKEEYEKSKDYWKEDSYEVIIDGGCHGYFGNYGEQKGDGKALISKALQQEITKNEIIKYIIRNKTGD